VNRLDVSGRGAIVTGGAQGIGRAIAERLVASGARVRLWDIDSGQLAQTVAALGAAASGDLVDVTDPEAVAGATQRALEALGRLDVLVNNAGIAGPSVPLAEYPLEAWERVLRVNLTGPFLCSRAVIPHMVRAGYGRIVNVASIAGKEGNPNACAYSAAKAGLIALTKSLGKELATTGVLVNCVTPAAAQTAILDQVSPAHVEYMRARIPMNRFVKVEEIAALVGWLASAECSFSTGAVFDISGGRATY